MRPIITLTTDFGDGRYVAQMKGVLLGLCRDATLVDISHDIPPQDVLSAAYLLRDVVPSFPHGTIHLAIIDPGVGSDRRGIALRSGGVAPGHLLVGPDNGVFTSFLEGARGVELTAEQYRRTSVSPVFHGRDIFAPAAGHLASGVLMEDLGRPIDDPCQIPLPKVDSDGESVCGVVLYVDRFGNVVTNIEQPHLPSDGENGLRVEIGWAKVESLARTYSDVKRGEMLALIGSTGRLEVAVREGNAAERLGIKHLAGAPVKVRIARPSMYET